jgi:hypothetical protein
MNKKYNTIIVLAVIVILVMVLIFVKKEDKVKSVPIEPTQSEIELNQAVTTDTTKSINDSLNNINIDDTTDAELNVVDQELQKL